MCRIRQFALPFAHQPNFAASDFLTAPSNEAALAWLERTPNWPGLRLAISGEAGCGKTHLLHLWARRAGAAIWSGPALVGLPALPARGGIAIDDADAAADEAALLHLLNAAAEAGLPVLLAGRDAPARWPVRLPDLTSRLRAMQTVAILRPEESLLRAILARLLADRQLATPETVQDWLLLRLPRDGGTLAEAAARLDRAALAGGSGITRQLAAAVLCDMAGGGNSLDEDFVAEAGDRSTAPSLL
jgi:chromosomal replication initiation ATPase DnaA